MKFLRIVIQYVIASTLLAAAIGKLLDNRFAAERFAQWRLFPDWSYLVLPLAASLSELFLALWLFSGRYLRQAALVALAFHLVYTAMTLVELARGVTLPDCGCFGILFAHPLDWVMAFEDFGYAVLSYVLFQLASKTEEHNERLSVGKFHTRTASVL